MPRILVVDDNADNRDVLSRRLERKGFEVVCASGGKQAVEEAISNTPDLILMDMNMPDLDGWEASGQIRAEGVSIPIVALTAHAMSGDRERAIEAGCTDYHTKPIEMDKLLELIEKLVEAHRTSN